MLHFKRSTLDAAEHITLEKKPHSSCPMFAGFQPCSLALWQCVPLPAASSQCHVVYDHSGSLHVKGSIIRENHRGCRTQWAHSYHRKMRMRTVRAENVPASRLLPSPLRHAEARLEGWPLAAVVWGRGKWACSCSPHPALKQAPGGDLPPARPAFRLRVNFAPSKLASELGGFFAYPSLKQVVWVCSMGTLVTLEGSVRGLERV